MPSYNKVIQIGHLGRDPELKYTPQGTAICQFPMAVNNRQKKDGDWHDVPMWFKVKVWRKQAENVSQFLSKGSACLVEGKLSMEQWVNKDGKDVTTLVIDATDVKFLGGDGARPQSERPKAATAPKTIEESLNDDDIPF